MGNYQFKFLVNKGFQSKKLCILNKDSYTVEKFEPFLQLLSDNSSKQIQIFSAVGSSGHGKSTFLNFLLRSYLKDQIAKGEEAPYIFRASDSSKQVTIGVDYYCVNTPEKLTVFLDCQGMDGGDGNYNKKEVGQDESFQRSLSQLVSLICKISTTVFLISNDRFSHSNKELVTNSTSDLAVDQISRQKDFIFVKTKTKIKNNYVPVDEIESNFGKIVFMPYIDDKSEEGQNNSNIFEYNESVEELFESLVKDHVKNKQYKKDNNLLRQFQASQKCSVLHEYLISAYTLLTNRFGKFKSNTSNYFVIIDSLNKAKQEFELQIKELEKISHDKVKRLEIEIEEMKKERKHYSLFTLDTISQFSFSQLAIDYQTHYEKASANWRDQLQQLIHKCFENQSDEERTNVTEYFKRIGDVFLKRFDSEVNISDLKNIINTNLLLSSSLQGVSALLLYASEVAVVASLAGRFLVHVSAPVASVILSFISFVQLNSGFQNVKFESSIKTQKNQMRQQLFQKLNESNVLTFSDLQSILQSSLPSVFVKLPNNQLEFHCALLFLVFSNLQKTITKRHFNTYANQGFWNIYHDTMALYNNIKQTNRQFNINFQYVFERKSKVQEKELIQELNNNQKLQRLLNQVWQDFINQEESIRTLYKNLVILRNINSFFLIRIITKIYFGDFLLQENVIRYFSNEDNIRFLTQVSV